MKRPDSPLEDRSTSEGSRWSPRECVWLMMLLRERAQHDTHAAVVLSDIRRDLLAQECPIPSSAGTSTTSA